MVRADHLGLRLDGRAGGAELHRHPGAAGRRLGGPPAPPPAAADSGAFAVDLGRALLLASIPLAALRGVLRIEQVYLVVLLVSLLSIFFDVAYQSYLPALIDPQDLLEGNSKLSASAAVAEFGSFSLAGWLVQALSAPLAILIDADPGAADPGAFAVALASGATWLSAALLIWAMASSLFTRSTRSACANCWQRRKCWGGSTPRCSGPGWAAAWPGRCWPAWRAG